ncbi:tail fiber assembly protein [Lelliottia nimipressuralis]|uniref:tail fiber assembly protein n=1 Tax=Lelliottia nimipressuralis TaxID=69220 RepID=UPI0035584D1E
MMYYSAAMNGFYSPELKDDYEAAGTWPDDATEISNEEYEALLNGQGSGQIIIPDANGKPELVTPAIDHVSETGSRKRLLLKEAAEIIFPLAMAVKHGMATEDETASLEAWEKYSVLVNRVNPGEDWPLKPE